MWARRVLRIRSLAATVATIVAVAGWFVFLRPPAFGGDTTYVLVKGVSMYPTLRDGDLVVARKAPRYRSGAVVVFHVPRGELGAGTLVIHRIVGGSPDEGFVLQGDNKSRPDRWHPKPSDIAGEMWFRVPFGGRVLEEARSPMAVGVLAGLLAVFVVLGWKPNVGPEPRPTSDEPRGGVGHGTDAAGDRSSRQPAETRASAGVQAPENLDDFCHREYRWWCDWPASPRAARHRGSVLKGRTAPAEDVSTGYSRREAGELL